MTRAALEWMACASPLCGEPLGGRPALKVIFANKITQRYHDACWWTLTNGTIPSETHVSGDGYDEQPQLWLCADPRELDAFAASVGISHTRGGPVAVAVAPVTQGLSFYRARRQGGCMAKYVGGQQ